MRDSCLTPTLLYENRLISSLVTNVDDEGKAAEGLWLDSSPAARNFQGNLTAEEIPAVNAYLDSFQVPEDKSPDSTMQVLARAASRLETMDFVMLDGMPPEMAEEFGYESVGLVHDTCCDSWTSCRVISPVPSTDGDGAVGSLDLIAQVQAGLILYAVIFVFGGCCLLAVVIFCVVRRLRRKHAS